MRSLLWKEWHEQRWKLAFTSLLLLGLTFFGLHARVVEDAVVLVSICILSTILLPLIVGAVLVAPEREVGTLQTLLSLPTRPRTILLTKTIVGIAVCVAPIVMACLLSLVMAGGREMLASTIVLLFAMSVLTTLFLFIWMLALTIRLPSEMRAMLLAIGIIVGWTIITMGLLEAKGDWGRWIGFIDPAVFLFGAFNSGMRAWLAIGFSVQIAVSVFLWLWAARRLSAEEVGS